MRLESKVALISGGARGMGAVEARMFANEGGPKLLSQICLRLRVVKWRLRLSSLVAISFLLI
ncbi:MAG: hypothetical protein Ct9H300mP11_06920 [Chloroflexota bacterium]|nr:MAG: hypothetical protein Ct9H300mP11_06920 [Chloroflexota bacterium]